MKIKSSLFNSLSGDALLLTFVKVITMSLGLINTRLLSQYLSVYDYGTYSQILLIVSTVSSLTILGMIDGVNFFYSGEADLKKRESYVVTIFTIQCILGAIVGCGVMMSGTLICQYFDNPDIKRLMIFAAVFPLIQNLTAMSQVLFVAVGKARLLAVRNLVISIVKILVVLMVIYVVNDIALILTVNLILDIAQIVFFWFILVKNGCKFKITAFDIGLIKRIFRYCIPMAVFLSVNALNRDIDKYLISMMTDTETLAIYSNASKQLPFDIIMLSFCTVLVPKLTKSISEKKFDDTALLYRKFLEITYISTGILCGAAISVAPHLMRLLYSDKYESGLVIFIIYILVDFFRFTNITLILCAAGKTKLLMVIGLAGLAFNAVTNVLFYNLFGITGPAIATLLTTVLLGVMMFVMNGKVLEVKLNAFFSFRNILMFIVESIALTLGLSYFSSVLQDSNWNYLVILFVVAGIYGAVMVMINGKRFIKNMKEMNRMVKKD